jgi:von Willebrand factor type A domain
MSPAETTLTAPYDTKESRCYSVRSVLLYKTKSFSHSALLLALVCAVASLLVAAPAAAAAKGGVGDFAVSIKRLPAGKKAKRASLRMRITNTRKWTATSVQACARVSPKKAKVVGAGGGAAIRYRGRSACWIVRQLKPRRSFNPKLEVRLKQSPAKKLKVTAWVAGGNSNTVTRRFKLAPPKPRRSKRRKARTAAAPCTAPTKLGVVFVTDDSGSMATSDPGHLRAQAIAVGLDQLPDGSLAAATSFWDTSATLFPVTTVDGTTRPGLKEDAKSLADSGGTNYDEAFLGAQAVLAEMSAADKRAVVFLSDGAPNDPAFVADDPIAAGGTPIYTIGLGVAGDPQAAAILTGIAAGSGGQFYEATSAAQLQSIFSRIVSTLTCDSQNISETFTLAPGASRSIPFTVEPSDREFRALATWSSGKVTVTAQRPDATTMTPTSLVSGEGFVQEPSYSLLTGSYPLVGQWQLTVTADQGNLSDVAVTIDVLRRLLPEQPPPPPATGRRLDPCMTSYPNFSPKTKNIFKGTETTYDRMSSLYFVCAGFGAPEGLNFSPEMKCALVAAAATFGGPVVSGGSDLACNTLAMSEALRTGDWLGYAAGQACGFFGEVFAEGAGIVMAGATSPSGPGAVAVGLGTYRALSAGMKLACGGLLDGGAAAIGAKIEADHQTNIAFDVLRKGRCIAYRVQFGISSWRAINCP